MFLFIAVYTGCLTLLYTRVGVKICASKHICVCCKGSVVSPFIFFQIKFICKGENVRITQRIGAFRSLRILFALIFHYGK
jgi:hypothetical protein